MRSFATALDKIIAGDPNPWGIALAPQRFDQLIRQGVAALTRGDTSAAIAAGRQALETSSFAKRRREPYTLFSYACLKNKQHDIAEDFARIALEHDPRSWDALNALALALRAMKPRESVAVLSYAL